MAESTKPALSAATQETNLRVLREIQAYLRNWSAGKVTHESTCQIIYQSMKDARTQ